MQKNNILEYLEDSAVRFSDKIALTDGAYSLTFGDLKERAEAIGSYLIKKGFFRQCIAILMDKHPDTVCAFFGVLYAGCFYACIDPSLPTSRIKAMSDRTRQVAVICRKRDRSMASSLFEKSEVICFEDAVMTDIDRNGIAWVREMVIDTDAAYVVFTSGSTGEPKGVCATHSSVIDYAQALVTTLGFDSDTVYGNQAPLYYDAPLKELLPMLALGATVCFIPRELFSFPATLCDFIKSNGINTLCWAASALAILSSLGGLSLLPSDQLRTVCFGSEVFDRCEYIRWRRAFPNTRFINLYGPTEATGMSTYWIASRDLGADEPIPIGKPFPNTEILLIDENGALSDEGEIYIRGRCVTQGYFGLFEASEGAFIQNPLNPYYRDIVYKTGDRAKINRYGELVFLGRGDHQIKRMGRRIELSEIERCAEMHGGVALARCVYDERSKRILLAYTGEVGEGDLRLLLRESLPSYALPSVAKRVDSLPLAPNGKTDRSALIKILLG